MWILYDKIVLLKSSWNSITCWLVSWLCFTSHRQQGHLETAAPFIVPCKGREARFLHRSHWESKPRLLRGSPLHNRCATPADIYYKIFKNINNSRTFKHSYQKSNISQRFQRSWDLIAHVPARRFFSTLACSSFGSWWNALGAPPGMAGGNFSSSNCCCIRWNSFLLAGTKNKD